MPVISGEDAEPALPSFESFQFPQALLRGVKERGFVTATPVQRDVIPIARQGGDLIAGAETGTGSVAQARIWLQPSQDAFHNLRLKARGPVHVTVVDGNGVPVDNPRAYFDSGEYDPTTVKIQNIGHQETSERITRAIFDRLVLTQFARDARHPLVIAGGAQAFSPEPMAEFVDAFVIGEGEETLPQLIGAIENGEDMRNVPGIAYKSEGSGRIVFTEKRDPANLDSYPPFGKILAPLEISRGCPWGCTYCQTPRLFGSMMRHRSISVITKYACRHKDIRFTSPNSLAYGSDGRAARLEKVEALLCSLSELEKPIYFGTFPSEVRPDEDMV